MARSSAPGCPKPAGRAKGAVVVIQEIFGVNSHIRAVTDSFAAEGYLAIAPSLFDRVRMGIELGYTDKDMQEGRGYVMQLQAGRDVERYRGGHSYRETRRPRRHGGLLLGREDVVSRRVRAAHRLRGFVLRRRHHAASRQEAEAAPVMYHYGERDKHITPDDVAKVKAAHPEGLFYIYPADHGFNCDQRGSYDAPSAALARQRTLEFFGQHLAADRPKGEIA